MASIVIASFLLGALCGTAIVVCLLDDTRYLADDIEETLQ